MKQGRSILKCLVFAAIMAMMLTPLFGGEIGAGFGCLVVLSSFLPMPISVIGMNNTNNISARQSYDQARKMFYKAMRNDPAFPSGPAGDRLCELWVNNLKFSQSEIRLEVELNAASTNFKFGLTQNQANSTGVQFNTENRLTMQDSLCCNEYGVYVGQPASRTDTAWQLRTYGNSQDFAAATALALNTTFYDHGWFQMKCNNDVIMPYRQLWNHKYLPQTQQTGALGAASPGDQIRGNEDGMITAEPNFVLIGSKGYIPEIVLPTAMAAATEFERCILIFRGVLAQNSTNVS